jgi:hypothetical protein
MNNLQISYNEAILYLAIWNAVLGLLFGVFPLFMGLRFKNRKYGVFGFVGSIIGGSIAGVVLSFPVAFIFTWLILRGLSADTIAAAVNEPEPTSESERSANQ